MRSTIYNILFKQLNEDCQNFENFSDIDEETLFTLYMQYNFRRMDVRAICRRMILETGSLYDLVHLPVHHLMYHFNISQAQAIAVANIGILSIRSQMKTVPGQKLLTLEQFYNHLYPYFIGINYEKTVIICLNARQQYIATEKITLCNPQQTVADPYLILELSRKHRAEYLVISHNHPNTCVDTLRPSQADVNSTLHLQQVLSAHGIPLIEHILMSYNGCRCLMHNYSPYYDPAYLPEEIRDSVNLETSPITPLNPEDSVWA